MSVYNSAAYVAVALDSVLAQTYTSWELVAVDDGSTDDSRAILEAYAAREPRLGVLALPHNQGVAAALNHGLAAARGTYVARLDADDICLPTRLATQVDYLDAHPAVGIVGSAILRMDDAGNTLEGVVGFPQTPAFVRWVHHFDATFSHPAVMMRRELLARIQGYRPGFAPAEDYDLWDRLLRLTDGANLPQPLVHYRTHAGMSSVQKQATQVQQMNVIRQRILHARLGTDVPSAVVAALGRAAYGRKVKAEPLAATTAAAAMRVLQQLYQAFVAQEALAPADAQLVARDYLRRLTRLARRARPRLQGLAAWARVVAGDLSPLWHGLGRG
jgi:hypothetical protein